MTRIALVAAHDGGDGRHREVAHLARALGALGHAAVVFARRDDPSLSDRVALGPNAVLEHLPAGPPRPVAGDALVGLDEFAAGLRRGLTAHGAEIVHAHSWESGEVAVAAATPSGTPVVQTFHGLASALRRHGVAIGAPERVAAERRLCQEIDRVIALCSDEFRELEALGCRGDRVSVVPYGFDGAVFHPQPDARWFEVDRAIRPVRLVAVGGLDARTGLSDVVRAVAELPDARLTIVGGPAAERLDDDPHHRELSELAVVLGTSDRIRFTGRLEPTALADILRAADLFVAAPWYEPAGIASIEAMGCGLPVVATAVGGLLDTVVDGGTGVLVPPHDPIALATAIDDLARQPELRHEMGSRAAWRAHRRFAWPVVARGVAEVYRRTLAGGRAHEWRA